MSRILSHAQGALCDHTYEMIWGHQQHTTNSETLSAQTLGGGGVTVKKRGNLIRRHPSQELLPLPRLGMLTHPS